MGRLLCCEQMSLDCEASRFHGLVRRQGIRPPLEASSSDATLRTWNAPLI